LIAAALLERDRLSISLAADGFRDFHLTMFATTRSGFLAAHRNVASQFLCRFVFPVSFSTKMRLAAPRHSMQAE
jgi:hypothetical protein